MPTGILHFWFFWDKGGDRIGMKGIIFDFDGTLFDSMWVWSDLDVMFLQRYGYVPTQKMREDIKTMSVWESAELFKNTFALPLEISDIVKELGEMVFEQYQHEVKPKEFVKDYLDKLKKAHIPMCIATAAHYKNVEAALVRENFTGYFEFIMSSDHIKSGKSSEEIYLECAGRLKLKPHEMIVFEDSLHGIMAAKKAGFYVIAVEDDSAFHEREKIRKTADKYIKSFKEMMIL